ncbi:MAG: hypothetical protein NT085_00745 [candidate division SR1 bacterium]|nr:hypothetical protein [candidate division SR1 bacterium]
MRLLKSSLIKKILGFVLVMLLSGVFLNGYVGTDGAITVSVGTQVHAADPTVTGNGTDSGIAGTTSTTSIWQTLNMVLKLIYLLLWPLLVIAGLALDNTLVYASVFHLDAPLWQFRNMMKNFANFTLGFMVLFAIIKSIFSNSGAGSAKDEKSPLGIIKTTLIAGVLIQASRFLMAATIDISTIATYAVGGLPLSVLKNTTIGDQKILPVNSKLDLNKFDITNAGGQEFQIWNTLKNKDQILKISPCKVARSYIIGREYGDTDYKNSAKLAAISGAYAGLEVCTLYGNQLVTWPEEDFITNLSSCLHEPAGSTGYTTSSPAEYKKAMNALTNVTGRQNLGCVTGKLVYLESGSAGFSTGNAIFGGSETLSIATVIQKSKGFVGPLVTIYSSLLNFAQLTDTNITSAAGTSGVFIIKSLVAIALFFPLIALALVLIARVGVLRLYIVASPFIILKASFKDFVKIKGLDEYLSVPGVIGIIFAPVVTVAALSISLIFMTALVNGFTSSDSTAAIHQTLGVQKLPANEVTPGNDGIVFDSIASLEFSKLSWGGAMDRFSWLMINFFAIGLMRMIFFAALKANALREGVGKKVQDFGENVFKTMPIIQLPGGGGGVGISNLQKGIGNIPDKWKNNQDTEQNKIVSDYMGFGEEKTPPTTIDSTLAGTLITADSNKASIIAGLTNAGVKADDVGTVISGSTDNIAATIAGLKLDDEKTKALAIAVDDASGNKLGTAWYTTATAKIAATAAKTALDAALKKGITDDMTTAAQVQVVLDTAANKELLNSYFKLNPTQKTCVVPVGVGKQITITNNSGVYTSTDPVAATTPATTIK